MPVFHEACSASDVPKERGFAVEVDGVRVALYRDGETIYALSGRCPHANGPLGMGWLEEGEAVCPLHRWRFKLKTGRCTTMRGEWVPVFPCEVRDGRVWVGV
jgi:nitrite reductase/ring-hydroxylating ferredoxin subunit